MQNNREGLDDETTRRLGSSILDFIDISRERGRSEHFLSGLETAYALVTGEGSVPDVSLYTDHPKLAI